MEEKQHDNHNKWHH